MGTQNWIIVGGGATGAAIALQGSRRGHHVTLVDRAPTAGGLTSTETFTVNAPAGSFTMKVVSVSREG